jgi:hypothetical protein
MKRIVLRVVLGLVLVAVVVGAALFQPWRLFTNSTVDEAAPSSTLSQTPVATADRPVDEPAEQPAEDGASGGASESVAPPPQDQVLAEGKFEDAEHGTTGVAKILQLADGRRFLRLEGLATSDGPDLHMWLTDQPSGGDWGSYDDGRYVRLGDLKANNGNQNYEIPAKADLTGMASVVIWCDRFNVAFGTAPITL